MTNSTVCMISRPSGIAVNPISRPGALAIAAAAMHSRHSTGSTIRPFIWCRMNWESFSGAVNTPNAAK